MTKAELMSYVGKKVYVYFKGGERGIYGTLGYVDEFSAKYDYRKPNYFYIGNTSFKVSHIRKLEESEELDMKTYGDIYNEFCDKFPNADVEDYRPADPMYIPQLLRGIPYAILVWLKDGSKVIYVAESEE